MSGWVPATNYCNLLQRFRRLINRRSGRETWSNGWQTLQTADSARS